MMIEEKSDLENKPQKKSKIPYFFFAFFFVSISVNIFYIYLSKKTWSGVVTEDSYQKGMQYNKFFADAKKQKELGWQIKLSYQNLGAAQGDLEIFLRDKNGKEIRDAEIAIYFKRPTNAGADFVEKIKFTDAGYKAKITFPLRGQWDFIINATKDKNVLQESKRYVVQ